MPGLLLFATGAWRAVLAGLLLTAALILASVVAFGFRPWRSFVEWTVPFHARLLTHLKPDGASTTISLYTGLRLAGVPSKIAQALQYVLSLILIGSSMLLIRAKGLTPRILAIALLAMIIALPYSNHYDLAIAAPVFTLALFDSQAPWQDGIAPSPITLLLWQAPVLAMVSLLGFQAVPLANVTVAACLILLMFRSGRPALRRA